MTKSLSGRAVLLWVICFFAVVISVNVYFIVISVTSFSGEDEQKPYLQGVEYNAVLHRRAAQAALGWHAAISADRLPTGLVRVAVVLRQPEQGAGEPSALQGELRHPSDENRDKAFALVKAGPGLYQADINGVDAGAWDMIVRNGTSSQPFEASRRLWLR